MNIKLDNTRVLHYYHPLPSLPPRWKEKISDIQEAIIPPKRDKKGGKNVSSISRPDSKISVRYSS